MRPCGLPGGRGPSDAGPSVRVEAGVAAASEGAATPAAAVLAAMPNCLIKARRLVSPGLPSAGPAGLPSKLPPFLELVFVALMIALPYPLACLNCGGKRRVYVTATPKS